MKKIKLLFLFLLSTCTFQLGFAQNWCWGREGVVNGKANDRCSPIATNRFGSVYLTGQYEPVIIFGKDTLVDYGYLENALIVKYDSYGNVLWAKQPKTSGFNNSEGMAIVSDVYDNVYITGWADSTLIFDADTVQIPLYSGAGFFVKYSPSGKVLWATNKAGSALTIDPKGDIWMASDSLYKFDPNGKVLFKKNIWDSVNRYFINSIVTDSLGNVCSAGFLDTTINAEETYIPMTVKYDSNGKELWTHIASFHSMACSGEDNAVITDHAGNVYIAGFFEDTVGFGPYTIVCMDYTFSLFLVKYSANGKLLWVKETKGLTTWRATSLAKDRSDNIYMGGSGINDDSLTFGGKTFTISPASNASFILKLDTSANVISGSVLRNGVITVIPEQYVNKLAVDSDGKYCYLSGTFESDTIFCANDTLVAGPGQFCYVAKWNQEQCIYDVNLGVPPLATLAPSVLLYPNPSNGKFTIAISHPELVSGSQTIQVYNMLGAKVYDGMLKQVQHDYELNLSAEPNGIYLYRVTDETGNLIGNGKFIIQK